VCVFSFRVLLPLRRRFLQLPCIKLLVCNRTFITLSLLTGFLSSNSARESDGTIARRSRICLEPAAFPRLGPTSQRSLYGQTEGSISELCLASSSFAWEASLATATPCLIYWLLFPRLPAESPMGESDCAIAVVITLLFSDDGS
jgi:hypothetical protein